MEVLRRALARALCPGMPEEDAALAAWLAPRVVALSRGLTRERKLARTGYLDEREMLAAYLLYYAPVNAARLRAVLPPLRPGARVLDLGCGPGTALEALPEDVDYVGVDRAARALEVAERLAAGRRARLLSARLLSARLGREELPEGRFDLVLFSYSWNEVAEPGLAQAAARRVGPGGALLLLEPATREAAEGLQRLREAPPEGLAIESPCTHGGPCPLLGEARRFGWCHQEIDWDRPPLVARVDRLCGLDKERLKLSHLRLRRGPVEPGGWRALSPALRGNGTLTAHLCGEGAAREAVLLLKHNSEENAAFAEIRRGDRVELEAPRRGEALRLEPGTRVVVHRFGAT